jgi:DNA-directed RNA polymerase specialized sigma24 family protein
VAENNQALTKEEQDFAAEHHHLILTHLAVNHLRFDDWYDVLVFGYLKAVRVWFRCPHVRKWAFATIAKVKMRSAMIEQFRYENRAMRRGVVISLDAPLQEDEAATLYGLIASGEGEEEQAVFEMLFESLASGLSTKEKAVLRLKSEGFPMTEICRELGLPRKEVAGIVATIQSRCEEQRSEAV